MIFSFTTDEATNQETKHHYRVNLFQFMTAFHKIKIGVLSELLKHRTEYLAVHFGLSEASNLTKGNK